MLRIKEVHVSKWAPGDCVVTTNDVMDRQDFHERSGPYFNGSFYQRGLTEIRTCIGNQRFVHPYMGLNHLSPP